VTAILPVIWFCVALGAGGQAAQRGIILSVAFFGNENMDEATLLHAMRVTQEGNWYSPEVLRFELQEIERLYQEKGFLKARVGPPEVSERRLEGGRQGVAIRIPVAEGPLFRLGRLAIRGAEVLAPATLLQMAPIEPGGPYSRPLMMEWIERLRSSYHELGRIRFEARLHEEAREAERTVDCTLEVREGAEYRVGRISVADNAVDPAELRRLLLVGEGGVYNPEMLLTSIQYINMSKRYRPFGPSDVEVRVDDSARTVDLVFHLRPQGKPGPGGRTKPPGRAPEGS